VQAFLLRCLCEHNWVFSKPDPHFGITLTNSDGVTICFYVASLTQTSSQTSCMRSSSTQRFSSLCVSSKGCQCQEVSLSSTGIIVSVSFDNRKVVSFVDNLGVQWYPRNMGDISLAQSRLALPNFIFNLVRITLLATSTCLLPWGIILMRVDVLRRATFRIVRIYY